MCRSSEIHIYDLHAAFASTKILLNITCLSFLLVLKTQTRSGSPGVPEHEREKIDEKNQSQAKLTEWNCRAEKIHYLSQLCEGLLCEPSEKLWVARHVYLFLSGLKSVQQEFMCFWRCPRKLITAKNHSRSLLCWKKNTSRRMMRFKNNQHGIMCAASDVSKERHGPTHVEPVRARKSVARKSM